MNIGKRSGTQRAMIGTDLRGIPTILATDGGWIKSYCEEIGVYADEVGLVGKHDCQEPGLYLWEGYGEIVNYGAWDEPCEPSVEYTGSIRKVRPDEIETLYAMVPPPQEEDNSNDMGS